MYRSKSEINKKIAQAKYVLSQLTKFEGRLFVNSGRDAETGSYPLLTQLSSFAAQGRSVFQYALEEARQRGKQRDYEEFVRNSPIIRCFKDLRNEDMHKYTPGMHVTVEASSPITHIDPKTGVGKGEPFNLYVESLDDLDNPKGHNKEVAITTKITRRIEVTADVISELKEYGRSDLIAAAQKGKALYGAFQCEGEQNLFELCRIYIDEIERFVEYGVKQGFIT